MIRAVLLDLDDTLIVNPDDRFVAGFAALAQQALAPALGIVDAAALLRQVLQSLSQPRDHIISNLDLIVERMADASGHSADGVRAALDDFYRAVYPQLAALVAPVPGAAALLDDLTAQGLPVVIVTNPVYPAAGIRQRLEWGQIAAHRYALITDADTVHFAKPDPALYAEVIARIGVEPDEAIMIGDNPLNDIQAAAAAGLHTFAIDASRTDRLTPVQQMIHRHDWRTVSDIPALSQDAILHALRGNQGALAGLIRLTTPAQWLLHPIPGEWSLQQIAAHLLESEITTQRARLEQILSHSGASLPMLVERTPTGAVTIPAEGSLPQLFSNWLKERAHTLQWLRTLTPADWERPAHHSVFGYTTLREMAAFTAQHDRMHIQQFCQTLGRCQEA